MLIPGYYEDPGILKYIFPDSVFMVEPEVESWLIPDTSNIPDINIDNDNSFPFYRPSNDPDPNGGGPNNPGGGPNMPSGPGGGNPGNPGNPGGGNNNDPAI